MTFKSYRKKPVVIQAAQLTRDYVQRDRICDWAASVKVGEIIPVVPSRDGYDVIVHTLEGTLVAKPGDYIVRGVAGEFYPVEKRIFEMTYVEVA